VIGSNGHFLKQHRCLNVSICSVCCCMQNCCLLNWVISRENGRLKASDWLPYDQINFFSALPVIKYNSKQHQTKMLVCYKKTFSTVDLYSRWTNIIHLFQSRKMPIWKVFYYMRCIFPRRVTFLCQPSRIPGPDPQYSQNGHFKKGGGGWMLIWHF
jgi:hypothetical protein